MTAAPLGSLTQKIVIPALRVAEKNIPQAGQYVNYAFLQLCSRRASGLLARFICVPIATI